MDLINCSLCVSLSIFSIVCISKILDCYTIWAGADH